MGAPPDAGGAFSAGMVPAASALRRLPCGVCFAASALRRLALGRGRRVETLGGVSWAGMVV